MDRDRWRRVRALFDEALEIAPPQRGAWLRGACAGDDALRDEVASLLAADRGPTDDPALAAVAPAPLDELANEPDDARIGRTIGAWRLTGVLGRGGMGVVYLAEREGAEFAQRAAVKLIRAGYGAETLARRLAEECRIL